MRQDLGGFVLSQSIITNEKVDRKFCRDRLNNDRVAQAGSALQKVRRDPTSACAPHDIYLAIHPI
jgi:hypothetical protein